MGVRGCMGVIIRGEGLGYSTSCLKRSSVSDAIR